MNVFYQPDIKNGVYYLDINESRHCVKVLRLHVDDIINIMDGVGGSYKAKIVSDNPKKCEFTIVEHEQLPKTNFNIHIAIAPTKNMDRVEWFVEKAVEFGVNQISFIHCDNSERKILKTDRIRKKVIEASKQSLKSYIPGITELMPFEQFINSLQADNKFIAYVDFDNAKKLSDALPNESYCVLIGPEGDFSTNELKMALNNDFKQVSLGNSRLRTETAGIAACHILNLLNDN